MPSWSKQEYITISDQACKAKSQLISSVTKVTSVCHDMSQANKRDDQSTEKETADTPPSKHPRIVCPLAPVKEKVESGTQTSGKPALSKGQIRQLRNSWSEYSKRITEDQ